MGQAPGVHPANGLLSEVSSDDLISAVRIWVVSTEGSNSKDIFEGVLSATERERANRFRLAASRNSFVITRAALRGFLGAYLQCRPRDVEFLYGTQGKPAVSAPVRFSVAHSGELSVLAFAVGIELGVDVEQVRTFPDWLEIAARQFCAEEAKDLSALPETAREAAFFRCWTRKEAFVKATGEGFSLPIDRFRVTVCPDAAPALIWCADGTNPDDWNLHDLDLPPGFAGALAYEGNRRPVRCSAVPTAESLIRMFA